MTQPAPPHDPLHASVRPWRLCAWEQCPDCGNDLLYRPVGGWDPTTDDGDNDGWTENENGERVPQTWREDLVHEGDPWVCADSTCRARGAWSADDGIAWPGDAHEFMDEVAHAQLLAEALAEPSAVLGPS